jgi:hypothetical protein
MTMNPILMQRIPGLGSTTPRNPQSCAGDDTPQYCSGGQERGGRERNDPPDSVLEVTAADTRRGARRRRRGRVCEEENEEDQLAWNSAGKGEQATLEGAHAVQKEDGGGSQYGELDALTLPWLHPALQEEE